MSLRHNNGFTLIEIAIVMVIIGLVMGGGLAIMRTLTERKFRNASVDYLNKARETVITFARINGRLPWADSNSPRDGIEDAGVTVGTLPFATLGIPPADAYKRAVAYEINPGLTTATNPITNMVTSCNALQAGLTGRPRIIDADAGPGGSAVSVAAVLISAGPMDADGDGSVFDTITGASGGNNRTGNPNYIRSPPVATFDDLVVYIGENELYGGMCENLILTVIDTTGSTTFYVRDLTRGVDLSGAGPFQIISGTRIGIFSAPNGVGPIATTPVTPVTIAGQDRTITIP